MRKVSWKQKAKIAWMVLFHRKTPFAAKATLVGGLLYGLMPIDLIPDILPLLGMADDTVLLVVVIMAFLHLTKNLRKEMEKEKTIIDVEPL